MANPTVTIETNHGTITAEMYMDKAPKTAGNFIDLAKKGYYDDLIFHRVIEDFMIQGGCPDGTGTAGPGYNIPDEFAEGLAHTAKGIFSMANAGPNTGGSQFFLTFLPTDYLNGRHTVFGRVVDGFDVLHKLQRRNPESPNPPNPDKIVEAKVLKKRNHPYVPKKVGEEFDQ